MSFLFACEIRRRDAKNNRHTCFFDKCARTIDVTFYAAPPQSAGSEHNDYIIIKTRCQAVKNKCRICICFLLNCAKFGKCPPIHGVYLSEKGYAIMKNRTVEIIYLRPFSAPRGRGSDGT